MSAPHAGQLIDGYLARLSDAAAGLPKGPRAELMDDMRTHIAEARARESGDETDATVLNILDRLGEPSVVVADMRERLGIPAVQPYRPGILEIAALVLLLLFWPIGVILLWLSPGWNWRDKLIGTLLPPGGYIGVGYWALAFAQSSSSTCVSVQAVGQAAQATCSSSGPLTAQAVLTTLMGIIFLVLPLLTAAYLALRLRWGKRAAASLA